MSFGFDIQGAEALQSNGKVRGQFVALDATELSSWKTLKIYGVLSWSFSTKIGILSMNWLLRQLKRAS